jgi:hypothetical protein
VGPITAAMAARSSGGSTSVFSFRVIIAPPGDIGVMQGAVFGLVLDQGAVEACLQDRPD